MSTPFRRISLRRPTIRVFVVLWVVVSCRNRPFSRRLARRQEPLTQIGGQVIDDTKALDATHRVETAILAYRREDRLWHATGRIPTGTRRYPLEGGGTDHSGFRSPRWHSQRASALAGGPG